ncbi:cation:proton antiporter [Candidatus Woesearchaeota archaeon]|nr:cation:proton antiporter [Candidatus Woesearchaeota archaeon]
MEVLVFLTYLAIILLIGIFCTFIAQKINIPNILLLISAGIILGNLPYKDTPLISFPPIFLTSIGILALVMIVFDFASRFKLGKFDKLSTQTLKLSVVFLILNLIFLTIFVNLVFDLESIFLVLLFSSLMSGTDPAAILSMLKPATHRVFELLRIESLINTPLVVLLPFIILDLMKTVEKELILTKFIEQILPFLQQFVVGIGSGVLVGIIMLKFMKREYSHVLSPLVMITAALITYILAENLKGNGVLAVTAMGLLFGNIYLRQKFQLQEFSSIFSNALEILVFVLIGLIIKIPFSLTFFLRSFILFIIYLVIRYIAIALSLRDLELSAKEKIFMALNAQKGIAVAVVAFTLSTFNIQGIQFILNLILTFMLYSIIISTIAIKFSKYFIEEKKVCKIQKK